MLTYFFGYFYWKLLMLKNTILFNYIHSKVFEGLKKKTGNQGSTLLQLHLQERLIGISRKYRNLKTFFKKLKIFHEVRFCLRDTLRNFRVFSGRLTWRNFCCEIILRPKNSFWYNIEILQCKCNRKEGANNKIKVYFLLFISIDSKIRKMSFHVGLLNID